MKYYLVTIEEYSGWECDGHLVDYIIAASSPEEAKEFVCVNKKLEGYEKSWVKVKDLALHKLGKKTKPFGVNL